LFFKLYIFLMCLKNDKVWFELKWMTESLSHWITIYSLLTAPLPQISNLIKLIIWGSEYTCGWTKCSFVFPSYLPLEILSCDLIILTVSIFPYRIIFLFSFGAYIIRGIFLSSTQQLLRIPYFCDCKFPVTLLKSYLPLFP